MPSSPPPTLDLLRRVGLAVRLWRERRSLSQKELAARSGLSVRFLAQLESGNGNISLRRLDEVTTALGISLVRLLSTAPTVRGLRVALLGLRGAGKSTIGERLAARLDTPFLELDRIIEESAGLSVGQIFELHGERYFRRLERETLGGLLNRGEAGVIATGGGIVTDSDSLELLRESCHTIWLSARPEDHYHRVLEQGDRRPMEDHPEAMAELRALLASREPLYRLADMTVDTSSASVAETVARIARALEVTA